MERPLSIRRALLIKQLKLVRQKEKDLVEYLNRLEKEYKMPDKPWLL